MIARYQRILFWTLVGGILLMTLFLLHGCEQAHKRLTEVDNAVPIAAPSSSAVEDVTLYLASDSDGSITASTRQLALPQERTLRARTLLNLLFAEYALPTSTHPLQNAPAVDDVFLLNLPVAVPSPGSSSDTAAAQLAVVNLHGAFVTNHPSGIAVEDLTIASIVGTLHSVFPQLTQVRFLVDGAAHDTLAGHADLLRTYPAIDTAYKTAPLAVETTQP